MVQLNVTSATPALNSLASTRQDQISFFFLLPSKGTEQQPVMWVVTNEWNVNNYSSQNNKLKMLSFCLKNVGLQNFWLYFCYRYRVPLNCLRRHLAGPTRKSMYITLSYYIVCFLVLITASTNYLRYLFNRQGHRGTAFTIPKRQASQTGFTRRQQPLAFCHKHSPTYPPDGSKSPHHNQQRPLQLRVLGGSRQSCKGE